MQHYETQRGMDSTEPLLSSGNSERQFFEESDPLIFFIPDAEETCLAELRQDSVFAVEVLALLPAPFSAYCE